MAVDTRLRKIMDQAKCPNMDFAEKEFALTHALQALDENGALEGLVFKGGTCIRKTLSGPSSRLSTDLDFTSLSMSLSPVDLVLAVNEITNAPFHGFKFSVGLEEGRGWYASERGDSVGFGIGYEHDGMGLEGEIRVQVSIRALPLLTPLRVPQIDQQYFKTLGFNPCHLLRLRVEEMLAEKIRALCQREKTRDLYDLNWFSGFPHNASVIRKLVVLKLRESGDEFEPDRFFSRLSPSMDWDWDDLASLVKGVDARHGEKMLNNCMRAFDFLNQLSVDEKAVAKDKHCRQNTLAEALTLGLVADAGGSEGRQWERPWERGVAPSR